VMGGLKVVADALNAGKMAHAMIAAVQLELPPLDWNGAVRIAQPDRHLAKYDPDEDRDWRGRWTTGGSDETIPLSSPAVTGSGDQEDKPAAASTSSEAAASLALPPDWVHLPPGERNDEIGDLLEWIANARPEDEAAIRGEIRRLFYAVGYMQGGNALNWALGRILHDHPDMQQRQEILGDIAHFADSDPAEIADLLNTMNAVLVLRPFGPAEVPVPAPGTYNVWELGWAKRGQVIEEALGKNTPGAFVTKRQHHTRAAGRDRSGDGAREEPGHRLLRHAFLKELDTMYCRCYLRRGIVFIPCSAEIKTGGYQHLEPVAVIPATDTDALRHAFLEAMARGNPIIPKYSPSPSGSALLKYAGVTSLSAFDRLASTWSIDEENGIYKIYFWRRGEPRGWVPDVERFVVLPPGSGAEEACERMIAIIRETAGLDAA
jgi:hypothetical protein